MKDAVTRFKDSGLCVVDIDSVASQFQHSRCRKGTNRLCADSFISLWKNINTGELEYTLVNVKNSTVTTKILIPEFQAKEIIKRKMLTARKNPVFRNGTTYRTRESWRVIDRAESNQRIKNLAKEAVA